MNIKSVMLVDRMTIANETSQVLLAARWKFEKSKDGCWIVATEAKEGGKVFEIPRERVAWVELGK